VNSAAHPEYSFEKCQEPSPIPEGQDNAFENFARLLTQSYRVLFVIHLLMVFNL